MQTRPDQIFELTRGVQLPLDPLHYDHLAIIVEVLSVAWQDLARTQRFTLLTGSEAELNAMMESRLSALLDEHMLWSQLVRSVSRGKETLSFDGKHLEKRPDLSIHLSCRNPSFPLVVECKLIDTENRKGHELYCKLGLTRFLTGEYSWATREAIMIAYVRDDSTICHSLTPFLAASQSMVPPPYAVEELPVRIDLLALDLARSIHSRAFRYLAQLPPNDVPGSIAIWHLWMSV